MPDPLDETQLSGIADRVKREFAGVFSAETVEATVRDSHDRLASRAKVTTFLPTLAERFARERLAAIAHTLSKPDSPIPDVLFVCVHNAGRSQMAAGLLDRRSGGAVSVRSAGSEPADQINPAVLEAMRELDIDLSRAFPKPLTDEVVKAADVVITMGCGDACPIYPGKRYLDWDLPDPEGKDLAAVRRIRDEIDRKVQVLLTELRGGDPT
ncbi:MAG: arsenate reductase ArsC [Candidatus Limnocylindria bacterium]